MATKLTFIENNETKSLLEEWTTGNIVTSNRLNKIQTAITNLDTALLGTERNSTTGMTTLENMLQVTSNQVTIGNAAIVTSSAATFNVDTAINAALTVGGSGSGQNKNLVVNGAISANSANINGSLTVGNNGNLSVAGGATITNNATIHGTVIANNKITLAESQVTTDVGSNELVSKALLDATISAEINTAIGALDSDHTINNDGYHIIKSITLTDGEVTNIGTIEIPTATDSQKGLMSLAHVTALNASAQTVSYTPVTMNEAGNVVIASSNTTASADKHTIALGNVVTSLDNVASKAEVNVLSKDLNGDYTDDDPTNHTIGLKDIVWGREATGNLGAITGLVENVNKLSSIADLPVTEGRYVLEVTMDNNNPVINWVQLTNDGGAST